MGRHVASLVLATALAACATTPAPEPRPVSRLEAPAVKVLLAGNTVKADRMALFVFYSPDGAQRLKGHPLTATDSGTWRVTDDGELCSRWQRLRDGEEACHPVLDLGGSYQAGLALFTVLPGNPERL